MLRRIIITLAAAAGLTVGGSAVASASTGAGSPHRSTPGHFDYVDPTFGAVSCNEVHHPSNRLPGSVPAGATTVGGYDTVQCKIVDAPSPLAGQEVDGGWFSDFGSQFDQNLGLIAAHVDGGGQGYHGVAWYPSG